MDERFRLRFPADELGQWADRYQYADDAEVEQIGRTAGARGWFTRAELLTVARWKTRGRSERKVELNTAALVRWATARALATNDERERVYALVALHGVQLPTASVLLHLARPNLYPIIDFRALWSLGIDRQPRSYGFAFWWAYVEACRSVAATARVSMRRLDRALWQYSKEHQTRGQASVGEAPKAPPRAGESRTKGATVTFPVETYPLSFPQRLRGTRSRTAPYLAAAAHGGETSTALPTTRRTTADRR